MKKILSLIIALALLMSFPSALVWAEGEPVLTSSGVLRLEAESYQSQVAATVVQYDSSASGNARLNFTSELSAAANLDFKVNVVTAGRYKVTVKWGTDSGNANSKILINGEEIIYAFQTIRDQLVMTNKRIISIDVQGLTGKRKSFSTMPYSKIQYFAIQTPGFAEVVPDSELFLMFSSGFTATFEFKGQVDIGVIGRMISEYVL